ncbi:MAG: sugar nucleotide-binding protein [Desulfomonile tiedjei]|nr:sugar nucleotide-binding protein [Desulfomonile tiedjei]
MSTLIVGSDSLIGSALLADFQRAGSSVLGTSRRVERADGSILHLDLSEDVRAWDCPCPVGIAVVCAGVTRLQSCRKDPEGTARINVRATLVLMEKLLRKGSFVIYLSSNLVFDGSWPVCPADWPLAPVTEYGREKAAVEREIAQWKNETAIVRLTKVLGPRQPLLAEWTGALKRGESIRPFSDMVFAPIPLSGVVSVLRLIADRHLPGIWQVSAPEDISYEEAARITAVTVGADSSLIRPLDSRSAGYEEHVPDHTTLSTETLRARLGLEIPDARWTVADAVRKSEAVTVLQPAP